MPTGAMKVDLCFSTASMRMTKTSSAVKKNSINKPCAVLVPPPSVVVTVIGPGKSADTTPAAAMPPTSCVANMRHARSQSRPPTRKSARVTCSSEYRWRREILWPRPYRRVEEPTRDAVKGPDISHQREAKCQGCV